MEELLALGGGSLGEWRVGEVKGEDNKYTKPRPATQGQVLGGLMVQTVEPSEVFDVSR